MKAWSIHSLRLSAIALAVAAGTAACSGPQASSATAPTALTGVTDGAGGTGRTPFKPPIRKYDPSISPASSAAGSVVQYTITLTNCAGAGDCAGVTSDQPLGSATVTVPTQFTSVGSPSISGTTGGVTWVVSSVVGNVISLRGAVAEGLNKLPPGGAVTFTITATAPCTAGSYQWTTHAFSGTDWSDENYTIAGAQASVQVTGSCTTSAACRYSQGYWEHNFNNWPSVGAGVALGNRTYSAGELLLILQNNAVNGNGLLALAHQLIAVKLNALNGVDVSSIQTSITAADALIGNLVVPPVGTDVLDSSQTGALTGVLDGFIQANDCSTANPL